MALFVNTGQVVQTMGPGRHQIDANELPGLGAVIDSITGGNAYRAELYFVGTREYTGFKFGGRVDDVQDPRTGLVVTRRVFDVNLSPEDEQQLKQLAKDTSYSQLAAGFQNYAAGEMALGAGQGMAKGGGAADGAFLGAGFGLASAFGAQQVQAQQAAQAQAAQQAAAQHGVPYGQGGPGGPQYGGQPQGGPPPQQASSGPVCASCQAPNPAGAKFCMGCGQALAPAVQHCTECGTEVPASAKFCSGCGTRVGA